MIKILAAGDFHGKVPRYLRKVIQKEKPDVIISPGDFCSFLEKKIWFKYCYGTYEPLWKFIGKKKHNQYLKRNKKKGEEVIHYLKSLNLPLYVVTGNADYVPHREIGETEMEKEMERPKPRTTDFLKKLKVSILDYSHKKFKESILIGYPRSSYPGIMRRHLKKKAWYRDEGRARQLLKDYKKHWQRMSKLFKNKRNVIFVSHNVPYRTKLDKITDTKADERARGHHYGSYLTKELIRKYQPRLCICGHMHENLGKQKIGKTWVVNCGDGSKGQYAIIELKGRQTKIKLHK